MRANKVYAPVQLVVVNTHRHTTNWGFLGPVQHFASYADTTVQRETNILLAHPRDFFVRFTEIFTYVFAFPVQTFTDKTTPI